VTIVVVLFWVSLAALVWTHAAYPAVVALWARIAPRRIRVGDETPSVTIIVAAHNEESVIERRVMNLLALDYPHSLVEVVVASDASDDRTDELAAAAGARVVRNVRGGKVAAQDRAVRESSSEIVAFSDANAVWETGALRQLVRSFADPAVAYVCGQLRLEAPDGSNREGLYWRYEMAVRSAESQLGSVTGGNGSIYAVRRGDYVEVDPRFGHDLSLPYLMVQRGRRAVYQPAALASEKPTPSVESEYRRKVRMFEHCWLILLRGKMLRGLGLRYTVEILSHRLLRYASGLLHILLLATSLALVTHGWIYDVVLAVQLALLLAALAGVAIARYYVLISWATVVALVNYLRRGVPATWKVAEGTR
jgi:cellulose synthase/poly-beta-1,6-N-acetylglucosamine synthase-like glycosyltransferase